MFQHSSFFYLREAHPICLLSLRGGAVLRFLSLELGGGVCTRICHNEILDLTPSHLIIVEPSISR